MCMFSGPVHVASTKIFASKVGGQQFTAYEMEFKQAALTRDRIVSGEDPPGVGMILPVPWKEDRAPIKLVDLSASDDFFDQIKRLVPETRYRSKSMGVASRSFSDDHLEVHKVGSFDISLAYSVEDIDRANPDVFTLSEDAKNTIQKHYKKGYAFVIAALRDAGKIHPLAWIAESDSSHIFVPTRHEHGNRWDLPAWDHDIYVNGSGDPFRNPADAPTRNHFTAGMDADHNFATEVKMGLANKVPEVRKFLMGQKINRYRYNGRFKNIDFRVAADA